MNESAAAQAILNRLEATDAAGKLFTERELARALMLDAVARLPEAISLLVKEGKLLRLTRGKSVYYLRRAVVEEAAPLPPAEPTPLRAQAPQEGERMSIRDAYDSLVNETGRVDVPIAQLTGPHPDLAAATPPVALSPKPVRTTDPESGRLAARFVGNSGGGSRCRRGIASPGSLQIDARSVRADGLRGAVEHLGIRNVNTPCPQRSACSGFGW